MVFNIHKSTPKELFQLAKQPEFTKQFLQLSDDDKKLCISKIKKYEDSLKNPPPAPRELLKNVSHALMDWAKDGFKMTDKELYDKRMEVCRACKYWNEMPGSPLIGRCSKCGCYGAKQKIRASKCPIGLW